MMQGIAAMKMIQTQAEGVLQILLKRIFLLPQFLPTLFSAG